MTTRTLTASRSVLDATLPFALPIGLSAFLLFSVEPLIGRLVLPVFGGAPAVWATTLFFFQAVLLCGYLYAHLSVTVFGRWGPPIHLVLAGLAFVVLLNAPSRLGELRNDEVTPVVDLLGLLIALVGLPAFVLTTTTPLLSGWFHAAHGDREGDSYWLYALSNGGSLIALLAYPLIIEPRLGLGTQRGLWAIGYAALMVFIVLAAIRALPDLMARRSAPAVAPEPPMGSVADGAADTAPRPVDWPRRVRWLLLAAIPSGLLAAVTNFIATDLVSAPLLWVMPLALYLASFIVAFSPRGQRVVGLAAAAAPAMITLLWVPYGSAGGWPILVLLVAELVAFATISIALHGRLAQDRPDPTHLTEFYLILSTGGALASAFVAIIAPSLFPDIWEYPILLVGALVGLATLSAHSAVPRMGRRGLDFRPFVAGFWRRVVPYGVGSALLAFALIASGSLAAEAGIRWLLVGGAILAVGGRPWFLAVATAFVLGLATFVLKPAAEFQDRSFFGVTEVIRPGSGGVTFLMNGTTVHGAQLTDPAKRRTPISYYGADGPVGDIFEVGAASSAVDPKRVAIVGLGAGGLAAYEDVWMSMTFFEIDPVVVEAASDPRYFTFLSDAPGRPDIVIGDARLSLVEEPDGAYDLLVMDAFSSDAIPLHLITVEAITDELRIVAQDGVIAFNVSNRYWDLSPAISAALQELSVTTLRQTGSGGDGEGLLPSTWLVASRSAERVAALRARGWADATPADRPFTDDYADLLSYLRLGF